MGKIWDSVLRLGTRCWVVLRRNQRDGTNSADSSISRKKGFGGIEKSADITEANHLDRSLMHNYPHYMRLLTC